MGSVLLLAVLAIGGFAGGVGGSIKAGAQATTETAVTETAAPASAGQRLYMTSDFSWN